MAAAPISFDEHECEKPIQIKGKDGVVRNYTLREMDDDDLGVWMKRVGNRVQRKKGKVVKEDYSGFHSDLISLCLYDEAGNRVGKSVIQPWGARIKNGLFGLCQEMNGLSDRFDEDEEKNSEEGATVGGKGE